MMNNQYSTFLALYLPMCLVAHDRDIDSLVKKAVVTTYGIYCPLQLYSIMFSGTCIKACGVKNKAKMRHSRAHVRYTKSHVTFPTVFTTSI